MSAHTPGPWVAAPADEWRTASGEHVQYGRFNISAGCTDPFSDNYYRIASVSNVNGAEQNQANAKLIAAAPTMREALQKARDSLVAFKFVPGDANAWEPSDEENLAAVDAALALSTGAQP